MKLFSKTRIIVFLVGLIILGGIMTVSGTKNAATIWKKDFATLDKGIGDYREGELIKGEIEYVLDPIATLETTHTVYGVPTKKEQTPYFMCIIPQTEAEDSYFIIVHATNKDDISALRSLYGSTISAMGISDVEFEHTSKPVKMDLISKSIPPEVQTYAEQYLTEAGYTTAEIGNIMADLMLEQAYFDNMKYNPFIGLALMVVPGALLIFLWKRSKGRTVYVGADRMQNSAPGQMTNGAAPGRYDPSAYGQTQGSETPVQPTGAPTRRYDPSAYTKGTGYTEGQMDSIDTTHLDR